jgi:hypothetical protein
VHHLLLAQQVVQTTRNVIPGELSTRSLDVSYPGWLTSSVPTATGLDTMVTLCWLVRRSLLPYVYSGPSFP